MEQVPSSQDWHEVSSAAMMETDKAKLFAKMSEAEAAIFNRLQEIGVLKNCNAERSELEDAIRGLLVLKREQLKFPDWT